MFCVFIGGAFGPPLHGWPLSSPASRTSPLHLPLTHSLSGLALLLLHALLRLHLLLLHLLLLGFDGVLGVRVDAAVAVVTVRAGRVGVAVRRGGLPARRVGEIVDAVGGVGWRGGLAPAALFDGRHVLVLGQEARVLDLLGLGHVRLRHVYSRPVIETLVVLLLLLLLFG